MIAAGPNPFLTNLHHSILYILNAGRSPRHLHFVGCGRGSLHFISRPNLYEPATLVTTRLNTVEGDKALGRPFKVPTREVEMGEMGH